MRGYEIISNLCNSLVYLDIETSTDWAVFYGLIEYWKNETVYWESTDEIK